MVLMGHQSFRTIERDASSLWRLEYSKSQIHVFSHSAHMLLPIDLKPFLTPPVWKCGHFGTLEAKNWSFSAILELFPWNLRNLRRFREGGLEKNFLGKNFFFLLLTHSPHIYLATLKVSAQLEAILTLAKTVPFLVDSTYNTITRCLLKGRKQIQKPQLLLCR